MGIMAYSFLWVMQDFDHQPYGSGLRFRVRVLKAQGLGFRVLGFRV